MPSRTRQGFRLLLVASFAAALHVACGEDAVITGPDAIADGGSDGSAPVLGDAAAADGSLLDGSKPGDGGVSFGPKFASFVVQTQPTSIADAFNLAQAGEIAAAGGTGITLAYYFYQSGRYVTQVDGKRYDGTTAPGQPTDGDLVLWIQAAKAAKLAVTLKPHLELLPGSGTPPPWNGATPPIVPGGPNQPGDLGSRQVSGKQDDGSVVTVKCSANGIVTATSLPAATSPIFTQSDVGRRVLSTKGELPNTSLSSYGTVSPGDPGQPAWNTITSVISGTQVQLASAPPAAVGAFTMYVINDDPAHGAHVWFLDWESKLDHVVDVMMKNGGLDWLNLSTEQRQLTLAFDKEFRALIAYFRQKYPSLGITVGPNEDDGTGNSNLVDFDVVHFWDVLGLPDGKGGGRGLLALDAYMNLQTVADPEPISLATVKASWVQATTANGNVQNGWLGQMEKIRAAWQLRFPKKDFPWMFTEWGYRSIVGAGIRDNQVLDADGGAADQATGIRAFMETGWQKDWFLGFDYWAWAGPLAQTDPNPEVSFSPKAPAVSVFKSALPP